MTRLDVARQRLHNQQLSATDCKKPADVVKWLGAVQAQDYYGAKWALGQRMVSATDDVIEKAFADGKILRTHVMRPTWHFVAPADIRWLLRLTAPRVKASISHYLRKFELDEAVRKRSYKALANGLRGKQLTRDVLRKVLEQAGVSTSGQRLVHILGCAELDEVICSGPRQDKQFTYALFDERVPHTKTLTRDESLAELARRYFNSHGPATMQDFVWWSGLTTADARAGIDMIQRRLVQEVIDGKTYWLSSSAPAVPGSSQLAHLLPAYDEYLIAYKDRSAALSPMNGKRASKENVIFSSPIVIAGRVVGSWKRSFKDSSVIIAVSPFSPLTRAEKQAVNNAAKRYGSFLGLKVLLA